MAVRYINGVPVQVSGAIPGLTGKKVAGPPTRSGRKPKLNPKPVRAPRAKPKPKPRQTPTSRQVPGVTAPRVLGPPNRSGRLPRPNPRPVRRRQVPLQPAVRGGAFEDALRGNGGSQAAPEPQVAAPRGVTAADLARLQAQNDSGPIGDYFKNYFLPSAAGFLLGPGVAGVEAIRGVGEAGLGGALDYAIPDDADAPGFAGALIRGLNAQGRNLRGQGIHRVQRIGTGIKDAYVYKYGPLFSGDPRTTAVRAGQDPFGTAGDVATAWAVAGGLTRAGARGAGRAGLGREGGLIQRASDVSILSPAEARLAGRNRAGARYRPPREVTVPLNDEMANAPVLRVSRDRRPMSRNPLTREVIQRPAMRVADRSRARRAARADEIALENPDARVFMDRGVPRSVRANTSAGQAERLVKRNARELRYDAEIDRDFWMARNVDRAIRDMNALDQPRTAGGLIAARTQARGRRATPGTSPEQVAWRLHHEGRIPDNFDGMTPAQVRENIAARAEAHNRNYEARTRSDGLKPRTRYTREFIQAIREVPDHLIDLDAKVGDVRRGVGRDMSPAGQQARVRAALESTRGLSQAETDALADAGVITREVAEARNRLPSATDAGAQYGPDVAARQYKSSQRVFARARELEAEARAAREVGDLTRANALMKRAQATRETARNLKARSRETIATTARETPRAIELREKIADAKTPLQKKRLEAQLLREQRRNPGFTAPRYPERVQEGAYLKHIPADKRAGATRPAGAGGGLMQSDMKPSSGSLIRRANIDNDPQLVVLQARNVANRAVGPQSSQFLQRLVDQVAFKDGAGNPITASRPELIRAADPDRVAFVNVGRLRNATKELDDLEPGQGIDVTTGDIPVVVYGQKATGGEMELRIPEGANAGDYIAVSKPALDEWVGLMRDPSNFWQKYDNYLALWKGGLLAFSPRWYVNNFLGVGSQFMLLTTGDVRSIFQANRRLRKAIDESYKGVVENTLSMDVGMQPGVNYGNLRRAESAGFRFNNRMEGLFRRGAYFSRVKKILKDEGYKGLNKMSPEEWGTLLDNLPASVKKQAIREFELFLGDFRRFTKVERDVVKRIIPFYSWLRVITRLTFTMPFRNPLRWQTLNLLRQAYDQVYAFDDKQRVPSDQGSISVGDNGILSTRYANPGATLYGFVESMGTGKVADITDEALGWTTPAAQAPLRYAFPELGGNFLVTTPGAGGAVEGFGYDPAVDNSVTRQFGPATPRRNISDAILESVFPWTRNVRTVIQNGRDPFNDVPTFPIPTSPDDVLGLLMGRAPRSLVTNRNDPSIYQPERNRPSRPVNPLLGILGIPLKTEDREARRTRLDKQKKRVNTARKQTNKKRREVGLPEFGEYNFWWER